MLIASHGGVARQDNTSDPVRPAPNLAPEDLVLSYEESGPFIGFGLSLVLHTVVRYPPAASWPIPHEVWMLRRAVWGTDGQECLNKYAAYSIKGNYMIRSTSGKRIRLAAVALSALAAPVAFTSHGAVVANTACAQQLSGGVCCYYLGSVCGNSPNLQYRPQGPCC